MLLRQQPGSMVPANAQQRHVAVIGAGFAGLAAAKTLLAEGKGQVKVTVLEADTVVGGRARRGHLASGPVELGATWFHGTEGNPVYEYAIKLLSQGGGGNDGSSSSSSSSCTAGADAAQQQESPKDYTSNANGSDPRWELQLVAPGQPKPLSGPRHQAVMSAFEQYSLAVEEIAEDAEAAAASALASLKAHNTAAASSGTAKPVSSTGASAQAAEGLGKGSVAAAGRDLHHDTAVAGCSLGLILRARFDSIMAAAGPSEDTADAQQQTAEVRQHTDADAQQVKQEEANTQPAAEGQPVSPGEVAAWLSADESGSLKQAFAEGWGCRERLQRAYDGFHSADVAGLAHMTEYQDLDGPNIPVPGGYQSIAEALAAEAQNLGLQLHFSCPVDRIRWARSDGKVSVTLQATSTAAEAFGSSSLPNGSSDSSSGNSSGPEVVFDAVVVTSSLGVLKTSAQRLFEPRLPASKAEAIQRLHIGQVEKLFVEWPPEISSCKPSQQVAKQQDAPVAPAVQQQPAHVNTNYHAQQEQQPQASSADIVGSAAPKQPAVVGPRKPKPQQLHDVAAPGQAAAAATAAANAAGAAPQGTTAAAPGDSPSAAAAGSIGEDPYTTYCLIWPTQSEEWGQAWLQQQGQGEQALPMEVPARDPVYGRAAAAGATGAAGAAVASGQGGQHGQELPELPEWLYGLHSWRYGDGPEWIKPARSRAATVRTSNQHQPPSRSAVIWVTGRAAQHMGQLSDQQILQDLELLLQTYPAIPCPDDQHNQNGRKQVSLQDCKLLRSSWTTSPYFRGSYSYPSTLADGSTADALAAPLTAADAVTAGAKAVHAGCCAGADAGSNSQEQQGSAGSSGQGVLVCFAGEATSRIHMGTVHGAFNSGVREAHRLLRDWGMLQAEAVGAADAADAQGPAEYHAAFWL